MTNRKLGEIYFISDIKQWSLRFQITERYKEKGDRISLYLLFLQLYLLIPTSFCNPLCSFYSKDKKSYGFFIMSSIYNWSYTVWTWGYKVKYIKMPGS